MRQLYGLEASRLALTINYRSTASVLKVGNELLGEPASVGLSHRLLGARIVCASRRHMWCATDAPYAGQGLPVLLWEEAKVGARVLQSTSARLPRYLCAPALLPWAAFTCANLPMFLCRRRPPAAGGSQWREGRSSNQHCLSCVGAGRVGRGGELTLRQDGRRSAARCPQLALHLVGKAIPECQACA